VRIDAIACDLRERWPVADATIAAVTSNQVIEHLVDVDHFASEAYRVLRPGGRAVVSTENLASWHNIAATVFGWQPFSLTNISRVASGIGNPCANPRDAEPLAVGWHYVHVMTVRALRELLAAHGFTAIVTRGAGYYPLPARMGEHDPTHAAFITLAARRP
jgi:SAM-dependent methyltransferase